MGSIGNQNSPWPPYNTYKDCSQGICSIYCPQWCYIIFPPPPPTFSLGEDDSGTDFSPLIIAVIGILASAFILVTYYTIISKYCCRRGRGDSNIELNQDHDQMTNEAWQGTTSGLDEALIKSITVCKYKKSEGFIEGTDCSVCLSEFQENESLRLLPKCNHAFHLPCIDKWLKSHASCPLCRANLASTNIISSQEQAAAPSQESPRGTILSTLEYQHRINDAVLVIHELEGSVQEEAVFGLVVDVDIPKTPTQDVGSTQNMEQSDNIIEINQDLIQPIRRSVSLNFTRCPSQISIADILGISEDDGDDNDDYQIRDREKQRCNLEFG